MSSESRRAPDRFAPAVEGGHVTEGVIPTHGWSGGLPIGKVPRDGIGLYGPGIGLGRDHDGAWNCLTAVVDLDSAGQVAAAQRPWGGNHDVPLVAEDADDVFAIELNGGHDLGDDVPRKPERRGSPFI